MRNAIRSKNNHDHLHISHDMTKEGREVNKELLQKQERKTMVSHQKTLCSK